MLGILKNQNVTIDNEAMAKYMSTDEVTVTAGSIQNRVKRLKAMAKEDGVEGYVFSPSFDEILKVCANDTSSRAADHENGTGNPKAGTKTPRKRAATTTAGPDGESPTKKGKGKGGKAKKAAAEDGDDEEAGTEAVIKGEEDAEGDAA